MRVKRLCCFALLQIARLLVCPLSQRFLENSPFLIPLKNPPRSSLIVNQINTLTSVIKSKGLWNHELQTSGSAVNFDSFEHEIAPWQLSADR